MPTVTGTFIQATVCPGSYWPDLDQTFGPNFLWALICVDHNFYWTVFYLYYFHQIFTKFFVLKIVLDPNFFYHTFVGEKYLLFYEHCCNLVYFWARKNVWSQSIFGHDLPTCRVLSSMFSHPLLPMNIINICPKMLG